MKKENSINGRIETTGNENLKFENELLKVKLKTEFGMSDHVSSLDLQAENEWLKYIYEFEKLHMEGKRIKIYDLIGKPDYKKASDLNKEEVSAELEKLFRILIENDICLDMLCEYEDEVIYKFITEELFEEETDDIKIEGLKHCFIYEEFHPNHEYDLRKETEIFFEAVITRNWDENFDSHRLHDKIFINGKMLSIKDFNEMINKFQERNYLFTKHKTDICSINFNLDEKSAEVKGNVLMYIQSGAEICKEIKNDFHMEFIFDEFGFWVISGIKFPVFDF